MATSSGSRPTRWPSAPAGRSPSTSTAGSPRSSSEGAVRVTVVHLERLGVVVVLTLGGAEAAAARLADGTVAIADDRGRVLGIDLRTGAVTHDLRLQP